MEQMSDFETSPVRDKPGPQMLRLSMASANCADWKEKTHPHKAEEGAIERCTAVVTFDRRLRLSALTGKWRTLRNIRIGRSDARIEAPAAAESFKSVPA
jgi:hypothetical protein